MVGVLIFLFRLIAGLIVLFGAWFVFDNIHDRNTEMIIATIGLMYSFIFVISRRMQYFVLTVFSFLGRTSSYVQNVPYDHAVREELGLQTGGRSSVINILFAGLIEILCLIRLFTSLLNRGWDPLSEPIRTFLRSAGL